MREAFEQAILDRPDEIAGYAAYADWLQEQSDPRGEFIAVQLALEDESRPKAERKKLQAREAELLKAHEREWLGELAPHLLDPDADADEPVTRDKHNWRRGFLWVLDMDTRLLIGFAQALAAAPAARFLRELRISDTEYARSTNPEHGNLRVPTPPGFDRHYAHFELIGAPCLKNLRAFYTGGDDDVPPEDGWCDCHCFLPGLEHVIVAMPRIEELHLLCNEYNLDAVFALSNLTHLRVLRAYHVGERRRQHQYVYQLDVLAANPALANLTHLLFHPHWAEEGDGAGGDVSFIPLDQVRALVRSPHLKSLTHLQLRLSDMGDEGVREIIASGILKRLKWLDLRHGCITDEGAKLFASCPDSKNLERLDLSRNAVSASGLSLLRTARVNAVANKPLTEEELDRRDYLREGDFE
jgi:uncharacterized protein (TIGR02996 family)